MKKIFFLTSLALVSASLFACGSTNNSSSQPNSSTSSQETSSSSAEEVTEVILSGSKNVLVGRTIRLSASTDVTWESLNSDIATVDTAGVVTGVAKGEATIRATSTKNTSVYADWVVTVSPTVPSEINITIEGEGLISQDGNTYNLRMGKPVIASIDSDPSFETSYTISYSDQNYSGSIDVENISNTSIQLTPNREVSDVTLVFKILYGTDNSSSKQDIVYLNVLDENSENLLLLEERLSGSLSDEKTSLTSATIKKAITQNGSAYSTETLSYSSFNDATYLVESDGNETTNYFSGIRDNHYYLLAYDAASNNEIENIYSSIASTESDFSSYKENAKSIFDISGTAVYGFGNIVYDFFDASNTLSLNFVNFGDTTAYSYMTISIEDSKLSASSTFTKDEKNYAIHLTVNFDGTKLTSYTFEESYTTSDSVTYNYKEEMTSTFGSKVDDSSTNNSIYLDFDSYYFKDAIKVQDMSGITDSLGRYDYSDTSKFGGTVSTDETGHVTYTVPYNKSLPLKIVSDNGGNPLIDTITVTANNSEIDIPTLAESGIYTLSAKEGVVDGVHTMVEGTTTFTFTSGKNNLTTSVTVEFYIPDVSELNVTNAPSNNDFGTVYRNDVSNDYLYLNAEPDDSALTFEIVDETGTEKLTGIEIYNYPDGNVDNYPSYGYFVKGITNGTYKFKFRVVGTSVVTDETFTVTVVDPISASTIKKNIVDDAPTYVNKGSTSTTTVKFVSETQLSISYVATSVDEITKTVPYHIEDGHIVIDSLSDGSNYAFSDTNFYYQKIMAGNIRFESDFSAITLYLSYEAETPDKFFPITLTKDTSSEINYDDLASYLNGKTLTGTETFLYGDLTGNYTTSVTYTLNTGRLTFTGKTNGKIVTVDFSYTYDSTNKTITYSDVVTSSSALTFDATYYNNLNTTDNSLYMCVYVSNIKALVKFSLV